MRIGMISYPCDTDQLDAFSSIEVPAIFVLGVYTIDTFDILGKYSTVSTKVICVMEYKKQMSTWNYDKMMLDAN